MTRLLNCPRFTLLSGPESNGGTVVTGGKDFEVEGGTIPFRLTRDNRLHIKVSRDAAWLSSLAPKQHVLRVDQVAHGLVSEWVVAAKVQAKGSPYVEIYGEPLESILRDVGPIRDRVTGGGSYYSLGGVELTISEYLTSYILPYLSSVGVTWVTAGTIEDSSTHTISWDRWSPLRLLNELEARTRFEFRMRRTGEIDFLERIGSSAPVPVIAALKNLLSLVRTTDPSGFATVVQAFGGIPEGGTERATMGLALWRVADVSGSVITLEAHNGGTGPWVLEDQGVGLYVRKADGSLTVITSTEALTGETTVASASGITEGEDVMIVADASGSLVEELEDPEAISRVVGTFANDDYRGEANFATNPWVQDWANKPTAIFARVDGDHQAGDSTLSLKDIVPTNQAFVAGDMVCVLLPLGHPVHRVTASASASGGSVTLNVSPAVLAPSTQNNLFLRTNSPVALFAGLAAGAPDAWTDAQVGTANASIFVHRKTNADDVAGTIVALPDYTFYETFGVVTITSGLRVTVGGLTPGEVVYTGDALVFADTVFRFIIVGGTADGSGQVTVTLNANRPSTSAVGQAVNIIRPDFPTDLFRTPSTECVAMLAHRRNNMTDPGNAGCVFDLPTVTLPYVPTAPNVWLKAGITMRGEGALNNAGAVRPPVLQLWSDGVLLQQVVPPEIALAPSLIGDPRSYDKQIEMSVGIALTESITVTPRIIGAYRADTVNINAGHPFTFPRWLMLQVGSDDQAAPPIIGSHATKLWQAANDRLLLHRQLPEEIKVTAKELVEHFGLTPAEANLTLGGTVRLMDEETSTDDEYRVVEVIYDAVDPSNTQFTLTTRLREAMAAIERRFKELGEGAVRNTSSSTSEEDPPTVITTPPGNTPPPTGGTGTTGNARDIFVAASATPPTAPTGFTPYWHVNDYGVYRKWEDGAWAEIVESSLADKREAHAEGASLGVVLAEYEMLRQGFTTDDNGDASFAIPDDGFVDVVAMSHVYDTLSYAFTVNTNWQDVNTDLDLTLTGVQVGDVCEVTVVGEWSSGAQTAWLDVISRPGGTPANSWANNGAVSANGAGTGVGAWLGVTSVTSACSGSVSKTIVSGDLSGSTLSLRLIGRLNAASGTKTFTSYQLAAKVYR